MTYFFLRFWPVLLPILFYALWYFFVGRKQTIDGVPTRRFRDGPWYRILLSSFIIGVCCYVFFAMSIEPHKGEFTPSRLVDGKLIPSEVTQ